MSDRRPLTNLELFSFLVGVIIFSLVIMTGMVLVVGHPITWGGY